MLAVPALESGGAHWFTPASPDALLDASGDAVLLVEEHAYVATAMETMNRLEAPMAREAVRRSMSEPLDDDGFAEDAPSNG
jgi:hypothetical protein